MKALVWIVLGTTNSAVDNLSAVFGEIAQVIVEVGAHARGPTTSGLGWLRSR